MALIAVHSYARRSEVGPVLEIIHRRCGSRALAELQRDGLSGVADLTTAQLLAGLMSMTIIALGVAGEAGFELAVVKPVTTVAFRHSGSGRHLSLVQMIRMRKALEPELGQF
jgi:hypothetical protein